MSNPKSLYLFLKSKGLVKNIKQEYEPTLLPSPAIVQEVLDNPAQAQDVVSKNRQEFLLWKESLPPSDLADYNFIYNEI